jgi:hypothetical protein
VSDIECLWFSAADWGVGRHTLTENALTRNNRIHARGNLVGALRRVDAAHHDRDAPATIFRGERVGRPTRHSVAIFLLGYITQKPVFPENAVRLAPQGLAHFAAHCPIGYDSASRNPNGEAAMGVVSMIVTLLRAFLRPRAALAAENLALRQQLGAFAAEHGVHMVNEFTDYGTTSA